MIIRNKDKKADLKSRKKKNFKKRYWLLVDLAIAIVIFFLLLYKPSRYKPGVTIPISNNRKEISPYLTNVLLPQLYNGAQLQEPFDLVIIQKGINETISRSKWPQESNGVILSAPTVLFVPETIVLMGVANIKGVDLVITVEAGPKLNEDGLLNLNVEKVKIGAMNITPVARLMAKRMYADRLATVPVDTENLRAKIAASLLNDESFEPVFNIRDIFDTNEDIKLRVEKITITQEKVTIRLVPVS